MSDAAQRVIVIGAGPVGLCLALRLAQSRLTTDPAAAHRFSRGGLTR